MCECGNRARLGGVDRLARIGFWGLLFLFVLFYTSGVLKHILLHGAETVVTGEKARLPLPFFWRITFSAIHPRRKKEETEQHGAMIKKKVL